MTLLDTALTRQLGIELPLVCGAMYPCSNPELVGAVSRAGGIGVIQPLTLTYVHGLDFRAGVRRVRALAGDRPMGMNAPQAEQNAQFALNTLHWLSGLIEP